ncbi:hypothetical protein NFI96_026885, partial [Prochilodus magdalenae]
GVKVKRRKALQLVSGMLSLSLLIVALGIYTSTRTESLSITGYASGAILAFGSFLGVLGLCLEENRKQLGGPSVFGESGLYEVCVVAWGTERGVVWGTSHTDGRKIRLEVQL